MTTAFVLSGGGSLGAVQVGMLQALTERQVNPDLLVGTSAGAVNAAFLAGHGTAMRRSSGSRTAGRAPDAGTSSRSGRGRTCWPGPADARRCAHRTASPA